MAEPIRLPTVPLFPVPEAPKTQQEEWLEAFEHDFWAAYPRKVCKFASRKCWLRVRPWSQDQLDEIVAGLERWLAYWREAETAKEFIPHATTWLNQHRWEDEP